jgi:Sec-independent protein translocase protein TatA
MQLFNLGFGEVVFILIIAVVVLGPERIVRFSRQAGRFIRGVTASPLWRDVVVTSQELRQFPQRLVAESGLQDHVTHIRQEMAVLDGSLRSETLDLTPALPPLADEIKLS